MVKLTLKYQLAGILEFIDLVREFFQDIEDRVISGKGILQFPQSNDYRWFRVWIDVIRDPNPNYQNFRWNPSRGEYAKVAWMRGEYVWREDVIRFEATTFDYNVNAFDPALNNLAVCVWSSFAAKLNAIGVAVGLPPDLPGEFGFAEPVKLGITSLRFDCRDSTALQIRLSGLKIDAACPEGQPNPKEDFPPPPPLPKVPSNSGIDVSPPYESPDDDGNTQPFENDIIPPPLPPGEGMECAKYQVRLTGELSENQTNWNPVVYTQTVYGEYSDQFVFVPNTDGTGRITSINMFNRGFVSPATQCGEYQENLYQNLGSPGFYTRNFSSTITFVPD